MGIIEKAKAENKIIHAYYHDIWFTPEELEELQSQGKFCWGDSNFRLRSKEEVRDWLKKDIEGKIKKFSSILSREDLIAIIDEILKEGKFESTEETLKDCAIETYFYRIHRTVLLTRINDEFRAYGWDKDFPYTYFEKGKTLLEAMQKYYEYYKKEGRRCK